MFPLQTHARVELKEMYTNKGKKICSVKIIPETGAWLTFELDDKGEKWVKIDTRKRIPYSVFLHLFDGASDNDWFTFLQDVLPHEENNTITCAKETFSSMFLNEKNYELSAPVRSQLNEIGNSRSVSDTLTKEDVIAIGDYILRMKR